MEKWLKRNLKYIVIVLIGILVISKIQSCNRKMSNRIAEKNLIENRDSLLHEKNIIIGKKDLVIDSLKTVILTRNYEIMDLEKDLEIAGIKVNAAERRADAVQRTAERVKSNTTIQIKGAERDTTKTNQ